jgi:hypothetical protein
MGCQRYQSWITDQALGALAKDREAELLAHVEECAQCSAALHRSRVLHQAISLGIAKTVSAEPSPDLAARVCQRIAEPPAPARFAALFPVVAGALVFAAALLAFWLRPQAPSRQPGAPTQSHDAAATGRNPSQPAAVIRRPLTELPLHASKGSVEANRRSSRTANTAPAFFVLVPPGELQAVVQFAAAMNSSGVVRAQLKNNMEETRDPLEVKSLQFPALEMTKLEDGQPESDSGSR